MFVGVLNVYILFCLNVDRDFGLLNYLLNSIENKVYQNIKILAGDVRAMFALQ